MFDSEKALFAADTLFSIGCGRVFEGTYPMMWDSLLKLRALPDDFKLYCGHEYTASNVKFALSVDTDNPALKARAEEVTRLRAENKPTIPVLLGEEKKANVFLRADEPSVAAKLHMKAREKRKGSRLRKTQEQVMRRCRKQTPTSSRGRPQPLRKEALSRDVRAGRRRRWAVAVDRELFPAGAWRALALASYRPVEAWH